MKKFIPILIVIALGFGTFAHSEETLYQYAEDYTVIWKDYRAVDEITDAHFEGGTRPKEVLKRMIDAGRARLVSKKDVAQIVDIIDPSIIPGGAVWVYVKGLPGYWITSMQKFRREAEKTASLTWEETVKAEHARICKLSASKASAAIDPKTFLQFELASKMEDYDTRTRLLFEGKAVSLDEKSEIAYVGDEESKTFVWVIIKGEKGRFVIPRSSLSGLE
jgi:hypothetical protein